MSIYNKLLKIRMSENIVCYKIETNEKRVVVSINYCFFRFFLLLIELLFTYFSNYTRMVFDLIRNIFAIADCLSLQRCRVSRIRKFLLKTESMTARYQYTNRIGQFCSTKEVFLCCNFAHELRNPSLVDIKFRIPFS